IGVGQTVTMGIVSALGRSRLGVNQFENFIQTDAAINPGNSGGALIDVNGNLVGINSVIFSQTGGSQGIGFSIPVSLARNVMEQLIRSGSVTRGWIGVEVRDVTADLAASFPMTVRRGALIANILRGGPADRAFVRPGDVLVGVNGQPVTDSTAMLNLIAELPPGREATLEILREQQQVALKVKVGKRPANVSG
ncbi:MAG: PDZ domain-containing protein, partial [Burkholderiales bacterium]|nr:PDZ domain-containing protein [Burkholderiales bacterium]